MIQQNVSFGSTLKPALAERFCPMVNTIVAASAFRGQALPPSSGSVSSQIGGGISTRESGVYGQVQRCGACHAQPVVAVDIDEVICRYVDGFRRFLERIGHGLGSWDAQPAALFKEAHDPRSALRAAFARSGGLDLLDEVQGAVAGLTRLRAAGVRLEAVTTRPGAMRATTERLLRRLLPADTFAAVHHVQPGQKGRVCSQLGAQVLIDDQIPNAKDAATSGVSAILFDYQGEYWWTHTGGELPTGVTRFQSWNAVVDRVFEIVAPNSVIPTPRPVFGAARASLSSSRHYAGAAAKFPAASNQFGLRTICICA